PDANRYSIFVGGLSNGGSMDDKKTVRRKTLQLNFRRLGDRYLMESKEIRWEPPAEWIYRASSLKVGGPDDKKVGGLNGRNTVHEPAVRAVQPVKTPQLRN